jgi:hypothetical protein
MAVVTPPQNPLCVRSVEVLVIDLIRPHELRTAHAHRAAQSSDSWMPHPLSSCRPRSRSLVQRCTVWQLVVVLLFLLCPTHSKGFCHASERAFLSQSQTHVHQHVEGLHCLHARGSTHVHSHPPCAHRTRGAYLRGVREYHDVASSRRCDAESHSRCMHGLLFVRFFVVSPLDNSISGTHASTHESKACSAQPSLTASIGQPPTVERVALCEECAY